MPDKSKWDVDCENFNFFFHKLSALMTEAQREVLPKDLYFKIFKRGGAYDTTSTNKLSFLAKCFILIKALRKRMVIMIEDDNEGMDEKTYFEYKELLSKRKYSTSNAGELIEDSVFVLGNRELFDTYSKLNDLSCSPAYNYLIKAKNPVPNKTTEHRAYMDYVAKFLVNYEANRKRIHMNSGLGITEWLTLLTMYHGNEVSGSVIYKNIYKHSFNSSATKIKVAFGTLEASGYIEKFGKSKGMKMRITPLGRNKCTEIMNKYVINI